MCKQGYRALHYIAFMNNLDLNARCSIPPHTMGLALRSRSFSEYSCFMRSYVFHFVISPASKIARARRLHLPGRIHECGQ